MSKNRAAYDEAERIDLMERCREMYKINRGVKVWGKKFWLSISKSRSVSMNVLLKHFMHFDYD